MKIIGLGLDMAGTPLFPAQDEYMVTDSPVQSLGAERAGGKKKQLSGPLDNQMRRSELHGYR